MRDASYIAAAHPAAVIELLDRCEALEALLYEAVNAHTEPELLARIDAALSGAEEKEACLSGCHPEEGLSE